MIVTVFGYWIDYYYFYFSIFPYVLVLIEKICQTLRTAFDQMSKKPPSSSKILGYWYFQLDLGSVFATVVNMVLRI